MAGHLAFDGSIGIVFGIAFDKDQFRAAAHFRYAGKDLGDVAFFIARGYNH